MKLHSERVDNGLAEGATPFGRGGRGAVTSSPRRSKVGGVLSGSLELIGERLNPSGWFQRPAAEPKVTVSRLREVLDRDRALIAANPELNELAGAPVAPPGERAVHERPVQPAAPAAAERAPAEPPIAPEPPRPVVCNEPIRTRTMARLLASQGHPDRALSIYEYLLARPGADPTLRAEADALRAARAS